MNIVTPDSHSCLSLPTSEIFVSENQIYKLNPKCFHLLSEIVLSGAHLPNQVTPSHGNHQMRRTLFDGYLFKYCSAKYQTFHQVSEKTSQQTYSHGQKTTWKAFQMHPRAIKHQLTYPIELTFGSFLIGWKGILVILRNRLETDVRWRVLRGDKPYLNIFRWRRFRQWRAKLGETLEWKGLALIYDSRKQNKAGK